MCEVYSLSVDAGNPRRCDLLPVILVRPEGYNSHQIMVPYLGEDTGDEYDCTFLSRGMILKKICHSILRREDVP